MLVNYCIKYFNIFVICYDKMQQIYINFYFFIVGICFFDVDCLSQFCRNDFMLKCDIYNYCYCMQRLVCGYGYDIDCRNFYCFLGFKGICSNGYCYC